MKVLFVSASPVNNSLSIGNTFLNVMPDDYELASVYTKNGLPDKRIEKAFRVNEKMLLKGKHGVTVDGRYLVNGENGSGEINASLVDMARRKRFTLLFILQNLIWRLPFWKSEQLERFIGDFAPDMIFTVLSKNIYLNRIILHIAGITGKPLVVYGWDNDYFDNPYENSLLRRLMHRREKKYMRLVAEKADKIYVISEVMKRDYETAFSKPCEVLTKSRDFDAEPDYRRVYGSPLELVYTGNLGLNRWKTLSYIADALSEINRDGVKAVLKIYSQTPLTDEMKSALSKGENTRLMGSVGASEIPGIQNSADILVHAEGFDEKSQFYVKYSFSTKIVDYLKAARPIFAVGPAQIASIDCFLSGDCAVCATQQSEIKEKLETLINNPELLDGYAHRAYEYGKKRHNERSTMKSLATSFKELTNSYV